MGDNQFRYLLTVFLNLKRKGNFAFAPNHIGNITHKRHIENRLMCVFESFQWKADVISNETPNQLEYQ